MVTREEFLQAKVDQLIADNLELASKLEYNYDPDKPVRKLTLQEKLEINMGNSLKKFRIRNQDIRDIYGSMVREVNEPKFIDLTFDNNRVFISYYFVDLKKEGEEIKKGEGVKVDITKIEDGGLQQKYDMEKVLNELTDVKT